MNNKFAVVGLAILLAFSMLLLIKVGVQNYKLKERTTQLNSELMEADLAKGRAETRFGSADKYVLELEKAIQDEIKSREGLVTRYGELEAKYSVLKKNKRATKTKVVYRDSVVKVPVELELTEGMLYQATTSTTLIPVGELFGEYKDSRLDINAKLFPYPNSKRDVKWEFGYQLHLKLGAKFVEVRTSTGAINHYVELHEIDDHGKKHGKFDIYRLQFVVEKPFGKQLFFWAPHIDLGALGMAGTLPPRLSSGGTLGFSTSGYGLTVNDLDWRFLRLSIDLVDGMVGLGLTPALYNLGVLIPVVSNIWVGPHVHYGLPSEWKLGLFLGAVL